MFFYHRIMRPKDADGMANIVDPDPVCQDLCLKPWYHYSNVYGGARGDQIKVGSHEGR